MVNQGPLREWAWSYQGKGPARFACRIRDLVDFLRQHPFSTIPLVAPDAVTLVQPQESTARRATASHNTGQLSEDSGSEGGESAHREMQRQGQSEIPGRAAPGERQQGGPTGPTLTHAATDGQDLERQLQQELQSTSVAARLEMQPPTQGANSPWTAAESEPVQSRSAGKGRDPAGDGIGGSVSGLAAVSNILQHQASTARVRFEKGQEGREGRRDETVMPSNLGESAGKEEGREQEGGRASLTCRLLVVSCPFLDLPKPVLQGGLCACLDLLASCSAGLIMHDHDCMCSWAGAVSAAVLQPASRPPPRH